jgi:hypothetical protein
MLLMTLHIPLHQPNMCAFISFRSRFMKLIYYVQDGVLSIASPLPTGYWTQPAYALRGGFRYLTIVSTSDEPVSFSNLSCAISFSPSSANLRDYSGYFYAEDPVSDDKNFLTKGELYSMILNGTELDAFFVSSLVLGSIYRANKRCTPKHGTSDTSGEIRMGKQCHTWRGRANHCGRGMLFFFPINISCIET